MPSLHPDVLQTILNDIKIILSAHISVIASNAVSFSGIITLLNNNESNSIYLSANVSTFIVADLVLGSLFVQDVDICP